MDIYNKPYTYLIGWSSLEKFYYGVRFAKHCSPDDLWKKYFTSSKVVEDFVKTHGDPDIIEIRNTFDDVDKARLWETKVLKRIRAKDRKDFLNQTDNISINVSPERQLAKYTPNVRRKMSLSAKQRGYNPKQLSEARKKITYTKERRDKISKSLSKSLAESPRSSEWAKKHSDAMKKKAKRCEHCHAIVQNVTYNRWHGDRCKSRNT